jgi:hypothetical protein
MLLGFFCTGPATEWCMGIPRGQMIVSAAHLSECPQALGIYRGGLLVAAYVDDSLGASEAAVQRCAAQFMTVYAGEFGHDQGLSNGLVEWYPVADQSSSIGFPPSPGQAGYILQAFSWGDNPSDGSGPPFFRCNTGDTTASCAARYQAPSVTQLRTMWCRALGRHPHVIFWYYAADETVAVLRVERQACTQRSVAARPIQHGTKRVRQLLRRALQMLTSALEPLKGWGRGPALSSSRVGVSRSHRAPARRRSPGPLGSLQWTCLWWCDVRKIASSGATRTAPTGGRAAPKSRPTGGYRSAAGSGPAGR